MSIEDCRARLPMGQLWTALGLPDPSGKVSAACSGGAAAKICSPFRADKSPGCSVFSQGGRAFFKDFADGGKALDEVGVIEAAKGLATKEAIALYHEMAGVSMGKGPQDKTGMIDPEAARRRGEALRRKQEEERRRAAEEAERKEFETPKKAPMGKKIAREYDYLNARGEIAHRTIRFEPKEFRQKRRAVEGDDPQKVDRDGWVWTLAGAPLYPYHLPQILARRGERIWLVEGEKDAENLGELGLLTTTLPMGCGKWRDEYARWFRGRDVVIVADYDADHEDGKNPGRDGALKLAAELDGIAASVRVLELPMLWKNSSPGTDVSDWIAHHRAQGVSDADLREGIEFAACRDVARVPMKVAYAGVIYEGLRGSMQLNEDELASRVVRRERLMFCGGKFWSYKESGGYWEPEATGSRVEKLVRQGLHDAGGQTIITSAKVSSVIKLMQSEHPVSPNDLNSQPAGWVCFENGLLDTKTGELHPHRAGYYVTSRCPHRWNPSAVCPAWLDWLDGRQPDAETRAQIQELFGYCLAVDLQFHVFFMLYGDGGTGKSTCVSVLEDMVGDSNRISMQLEELSNPFMRHRLVGKALYLCKELTDKSFQHIGLIKAIVSGDPIDVDVKHGTGFDFKPFGRMVMESNVVAMTPDSSNGFARRFIQIDFDEKVKPSDIDPALPKKLSGEMEGIIVWAMEGVRRLRERQAFALTERSEEARREVLKHRGQVLSFWESGWVVDNGPGGEGQMPVGKLHDLYTEWCESEDVVPFFTEPGKFMREFMSRNKHLRARKRRLRDGDHRYYAILGLQQSAIAGVAEDYAEQVQF